jgi:alcohol dehydrogenase (cytochrome c)
MAFDGVTGKHLWHLQTGASLRAAPMTFTVNGKQFVVVASGGTVVALALPHGRNP